jgi:hypothetical protein
MHVVKLLPDVGALRPIRQVREAFAELVLSISQMIAMLSAMIIVRRRRCLTIAGCWWRRWLAYRHLANSRYSDLGLRERYMRKRTSEQDAD